MPKRKSSSLSRCSDQTRKKRRSRSEENNEHRHRRLQADRERYQSQREQETPQETHRRLQADRERHQSQREQETPQETHRRLQADRERHQSQREQETPEQTHRRLQADRERYQSQREQTQSRRSANRNRESTRRTTVARVARSSWSLSAFNYNPSHDYATSPQVIIGGKVRLPMIEEPPDPLKTLLTGNSQAAKQFQNKLSAYNAAFQMNSFGADKNLTDTGFFTTFKIQGQCYHLKGGLLPLTEEQPKFVQVYFMETGSEEEAVQRCRNIPSGLDVRTVADLQDMLHESHKYIKVTIRADKRPQGEHERRFNAPVTDEVAVVLLDEQHGSWDIVLKQRSGHLDRIPETHRAYDALQYPLLFWAGQDSYNFALKQVQPKTQEEFEQDPQVQDLNKSVSCKDFYAYHLMERTGFNHLLRFGRVTCQ
ncbi:hypothetical protein ACOMHN_002256 [Nucella lapillus]